MGIELDTQSKIKIHSLKVSGRGCINYQYFLVNNDTRDAIIVDPAWEKNSILREIESLSLNPKGIILTHYHSDHVSLADLFAKRYNIPVYMSDVEQDFYGFKCANLRVARDSESFYIDSLKVYPILTAGHTKGSMSFLVGDNLLTGDTIFIEGCGMMFGKGAEPRDMYESIQFLKKNLDKTVKIYPSHSYGEEPGKEFAYLLKYNIYFHFPDYESFAKFRLRKNQSGWFNFK